MRGLSSRGRWLVRRNVVSLIQREPSNTRDPHTVTRTNSPGRKRSKAPTAYSPSVWLLLREDARIGRIRLKVRGLEVMASTVTEMEVDQAIALLAREYWVFGITGSGSFGIMELQLKS